MSDTSTGKTNDEAATGTSFRQFVDGLQSEVWVHSPSDENKETVANILEKLYKRREKFWKGKSESEKVASLVSTLQDNGPLCELIKEDCCDEVAKLLYGKQLFRQFVDELKLEVWVVHSPRDEDKETVAKILENIYRKSEKFWKGKGKSESAKVANLAGPMRFNEPLCNLIKEDCCDEVAELLYHFVNKDQPDSSVAERKFVSIAFHIQELDLSHPFDLNAFSNRIDHVFNSYYNDKKLKSGKNRYIAPYFVFVQSSGMGKTKILYEYRQHFNATDDGKDLAAMMVLCRAKSDTPDRKMLETKVFDHFVDFCSLVSTKSTFEEAAQSVFVKLEELLRTAKGKDRVVLLFDEAHYLLSNMENTQSPLQAGIFRIVCLWLRRKRDEKVVAVFTGTNAKLCNFFIESDSDPHQATDTRERSNAEAYYVRGTELFNTFCCTTTIGCLRKAEDEEAENSNKSEYRKAIPYGRPLFAAMDQDDKVPQGLDTIICRMLVQPENWNKLEAAWISILGTRVQMGQMSFQMASTVVASAYANLVDCTKDSARVCFQPDPVCARLAMCLMDEQWQFSLPNNNPPNITGKSKYWWMERVHEIYSRGLCSPEKGDLGEVMVALYFLFCADCLRSRNQQESPTKQQDSIARQEETAYTTFSVPLHEWMNLLLSGGQKPEKIPQKRKRSEDWHISFGAIQVCRNYLRVYDQSWKELGDEKFLGHLYRSGVGFYVFAGCKTIDLVFPLKATSSKGDHYFLPMFVSVKAHAYYSPKAAEEECKKMKFKAEESQLQVGALCLLVVFGSDSMSNDGDWRLDASKCMEELSAKQIVANVLRVPFNDSFGVSKTYSALTSGRHAESEILASHSFLRVHERVQDEFAKASLRSSNGKNDAALQMVQALLPSKTTAASDSENYPG